MGGLRLHARKERILMASRPFGGERGEVSQTGPFQESCLCSCMFFSLRLNAGWEMPRMRQAVD